MSQQPEENLDDDPVQTALQDLLTEEQWEAIRAEGRLDDNCLPQIYEAIAEYRRQKPVDRRLIGQVRDAVLKALRLTDELRNDRDFLLVGTDQVDINWTSITDWIEGSEAFLKELGKANERFDLALRGVMVPADGALSDFVFSVLMIQAKHLRKAPPIHHKQSSANPRFVRYVYLCVQAADSDLAANRPDRIEIGLKKATASFKGQHDSSPVSWAAHWRSNLQSSE